MLIKKLILIVLGTANIAFANTSLLGFNWAKTRGLVMTQELIDQQEVKNPSGAEITPDFWEKLLVAQNDADHMAGDGLYFSTQLFDSARFGPNLLIVELILKSGDLSSFVSGLTAHETENTPPQRLSPVVRYAGSWHVIKRLPTEVEKQSFQLFLRPPRVEDADLIFHQLGLNNDLVKVMEYLYFIAQRGAKDDHETTQRFLKRFKDRLIEKVPLQGMNLDHLQAGQISRFNVYIQRLFELLDHRNQSQTIFGFDLKTHLYQSLLNSEGPNSDRVLTSLFYRDSELLIKMSRGQILRRVARNLPMMISLETFLITREKVLILGTNQLTSDELDVIRNLDLPSTKLFYVSPFYVDKIKEIPMRTQQKYLSSLREATKSPEEIEQLKSYLLAIGLNFEPTIKMCKSLFTN